MNTSKITGWQPILTREGEHRSVDGKYGKIYYFTVKFENGDEGSAPSKFQEPKWSTEEEYEYTIEEFNGFLNIKSLRKKGSFKAAQAVLSSSGNSNAHTALTCATRYIDARLRSGETHKSDDVFLLADKMKMWLEKNK